MGHGADEEGEVTRLEVVYNLGRMEQMLRENGSKPPYTVVMARDMAEHICAVMGRTWARKVKIGNIWIKSTAKGPIGTPVTLDNGAV